MEEIKNWDDLPIDISSIDKLLDKYLYYLESYKNKKIAIENTIEAAKDYLDDIIRISRGKKTREYYVEKLSNLFEKYRWVKDFDKIFEEFTKSLLKEIKNNDPRYYKHIIKESHPEMMKEEKEIRDEYISLYRKYQDYLVNKNKGEPIEKDLKDLQNRIKEFNLKGEGFFNLSTIDIDEMLNKIKTPLKISQPDNYFWL